MVMGVIVDIDGTTSWKFLKLFNGYLTLCKGARCGYKDTTSERGDNINTMHIQVLLLAQRLQYMRRYFGDYKLYQ